MLWPTPKATDTLELCCLVMANTAGQWHALANLFCLGQHRRLLTHHSRLALPIFFICNGQNTADHQHALPNLFSVYVCLTFLFLFFCRLHRRRHQGAFAAWKCSQPGLPFERRVRTLTNSTVADFKGRRLSRPLPLQRKKGVMRMRFSARNAGQ